MHRIAQRAAAGAVALGLVTAGTAFAGCNSDDTKKSINDAQSTVNKELNKAKHKINNSDVEKQFNKAKHKANKAINDVQDTVNSKANKAKKKADKVDNGY